MHNLITMKSTFVFTLIFLQYFLLFASALGKKSIETDQSALLAFKSHITSNSNSTHLLSNWTEATSVCSWIGVRCSTLHDRVIALNISRFGLQGTISSHIGNLSFLNLIDISSNDFRGQLPREIAKLRRLKHIDFSANEISGDISGWFVSLPKIRYLDLGNNQFAGALPSSLFNATKLEFLSLSYNQLTGYIPEEVGNLGNLRIFSMVYNQIEGSLPLSILNMSSLQDMAFTGNRLNGELPPEICSKIPRLAGIYLSENQFSGHVQSRFKNCSELHYLSLSVNNFTGHIPREIGNLTGLVGLYCGFTQFQGEIPPELGNLRNLEILSISNSFFTGQIPTEFGNLQRLLHIELDANFLNGPIPPSIFNITSLSSISLNRNNLTGSLPRNIGLHSPNLRIIGLAANRLTRAIPESISNLTKLTTLQLPENQFSGAFPASLGNLRFLKDLILFDNFLTSDSFGFLESLTSCRSLEMINIYNNPIHIQLPPSIGNFSRSLAYFYAQACEIKGTIPSQIGNVSGLLGLMLGTSLTELPPPTIQKLSNLQLLGLGRNKLSGLFPGYLCNMKQLSILFLGRNKLYGPLPNCLGNMTSLTVLSLFGNGFNSTLPAQIGSLKNLLSFDVNSNHLSGDITQAIGGLSAVVEIYFSNNRFLGNIPQSIGALGNLVNLSLAHNMLQGPIPETFKNLVSLERLDLSHNNLTGEIPSTLGALSQLKYFDVSFNHFRGRVPKNGSFANFGKDFFASNDALCGGPPHLDFPLCITDSHRKTSLKKKYRTIEYIWIPIASLVFLIIVVLFVFLRKKKKKVTLSQIELPLSFERISYYEIQRATNDFDESNFLGAGSFGNVYKAILRDGTVLAVKVFNQQMERALRSFETECEVFSNIRHRNLLKVISCCSNVDFKALILEYMPNGSLEKWLYSHNQFLDFSQRLNIMVDVASALDYLHHGYTSRIVHCDLKPSNVLLNEEMIGHVSDFGISKLLVGDETLVRTMTLATIGYTAPEYGSEGLVSTKCDVYSFGILLMETFTRRKPTDDMFEEGWGLKEMITDGLRKSETWFIDQNMLPTEHQKLNKMLKCIKMIVELSLRCVVDLPEQRLDANDVLVELKKIKTLFLSNSV